MAQRFPPPQRRAPTPTQFSFNANDDDEWEDDEDDEIDEDGVRRSRVDHLPLPAEIDGEGGYTEIDGEEAQHLPGRSSSPRLFVGGAGHPTVTQLKVYRVENGLPVSMGAIESEATEEDLVRVFFNSMPKPGEGRTQFRFRPIDSDNRELGVESSTWISENHSSLQRLRATRPDPAGGPAPLNMDAVMMGLLQNTIHRSQASVDDERLHSRSMLEQIGKERIDLANNITASIQGMSERMLSAETDRARAAIESENNRNKQASDSMAAFFQSQLDMLGSQREAEKLREEQRMERERNEAEIRLKEAEQRAAIHAKDHEIRAQAVLSEAQRLDDRRRDELTAKQRDEDRRWEQRMEMWREERKAERQEGERRERERERMRKEEREREREDRERRELAMQREHEWRLKQLEIEANNKREHDKIMAQVQQMQMQAAMQSARGGDLKSMLTEAATFLGAVGVDPKDLIGRFLSPPAEGANTEAWADLAGKVIGSMGEVAKAKMIADASKQRRDRRAALPARDVPMLPQGMPMMPSQMRMPVPVQQQMQPQQQFYPQMPPQQAPPVPQPPAPMQEAEPPAVIPPPEINLPFDVQRAARSGIRDLVQKLGSSKREQWESVITVALMQNAAIYDYIQVVSVAYALNEAGASEDFADQIIEALLDSPLVPDDLNYGFDTDGLDEDDEDDEGGAE